MGVVLPSVMEGVHPFTMIIKKTLVPFLVLLFLIESSTAAQWCFDNVEGNYEYCLNNITESDCYYNECVTIDGTQDYIIYRRIHAVDVNMDFTQSVLSKLLYGMIFLLVMATMIIGGIRIIMGRGLF